MAHGRTRRVRQKKEQEDGTEGGERIVIDTGEAANLIGETIITSTSTALFTWLILGRGNNVESS